MATGKKKVVTVRGVGRPRAVTSGSGLPAPQQIKVAGARLFATKGYASTTTREIAHEVGIRQPSLFYHFKRKQDILVAIIEEVSALWVEYLAELRGRGSPAAVSLYELMRFDYLYLMTEPYGVGQLMALPEMRGGEFSSLVEPAVDRIVAAYKEFVSRAIEEGDLRDIDPDVAANTLFGIGEATWSWYRRGSSQSADEVAEVLADLGMRGVLVKISRLNAIKKAAELKSAPDA